LDDIKSQEMQDHRIVVRTNAINFYRCFDLTKQPEFLCDFAEDIVEGVILDEVIYAQNYGSFNM